MILSRLPSGCACALPCGEERPLHFEWGLRRDCNSSSAVHQNCVLDLCPNSGDLLETR
jgi:hypothetical protein